VIPFNPSKHPKPDNKKPKMKRNLSYKGLSLLMAAVALLSAVVPAQAQDSPTPSSGAAGKKPNILFIMGDDIGMWNIGAYHRGLMAGRTPNLDAAMKEHEGQ
jgi:arylsulfatase